MDELNKNVLANINDMENKLSYLITKLYTFRNENNALLKKISNLERENDLLREKRDVTVTKLKTILQKMDEAGLKEQF
ncbi:hypothetical protein ACFL6G_09350 [candidate division KSB1 bacterium]